LRQRLRLRLRRDAIPHRRPRALSVALMALVAVPPVLLVIAVAALVTLAIWPDVARSVTTRTVGAIEWPAIALLRHRWEF